MVISCSKTKSPSTFAHDVNTPPLVANGFPSGFAALDWFQRQKKLLSPEITNSSS
jgi:hypothetical protein